MDIIIRAIPESLGLTNSGLTVEYNCAVWYISAMLLVMMPLCYLFIKKKDFFIYIFAPIAALFLLGFMYKQETRFVDRNTWFTICLGGIIRAVCGLCFGVIAWIVCEKIKSIAETKKNRIVITILEAALYIVFFYTWLIHRADGATLFCNMLILPPAIAISFSGKSYIGELFCFKWMKHLSGLTLIIYLNHWAARRIVTSLFPGMSYKRSLAYMILLTVLFCVINHFIVKLIRFLWGKRKAAQST